MTRTLPSLFLLAGALLVLSACGDTTAPSSGSAPVDASASSAHLLESDLPAALSVVAALEKDVDAEVEVYGRVQRTARGLFTLVDDEVVRYCGQGGQAMDDCPTPWDYCCENPETVRAATLLVEALDGAGQEVEKTSLGIRPLDLVAVRGRLAEDPSGQKVLRASSGWHRRERPVVRDDIRFP